MRRIPVFLLLLALCLPPAHAAEQTPFFSDVPAGSWFEQGVATCAQQGVMVGVGEGKFSPDTDLNAAECLTFALRLYDLQRGGDGTLETAPEDWGKLELVLSDGTTFTRYGYQYSFFSQDRFTGPDGSETSHLLVLAPGETTQEREAWAKAHEGAGTVRAYGVDYSGTLTTDSSYYGPCLRFDFDAPDNGGLDLNDLIDTTRPGPDKWFRNAVYTAEVWELREQPGFDSLTRLCYGNAGEAGWCDRGLFAEALSVAAGDLEKKYTVERIPDLERTEYTEAVYGLYEAGILGGMDEIGTFRSDKDLTRAEAAVMVARVLDESQRLSKAPTAPSAYDLAVAKLRNGTGHHNEQTFDTDDCTVFVFDRGGFMNAPSGMINVIYKAGSIPGEGTVIDLPHVRAGMQVTPADTMVFDPEKETFTYSYFFDKPVYDSSIESYDTRSEPGTYTFTVDLPTGEVHREYRGVDYAGAMAHVTRKRIISGSEHSEDREVVQTLESDQCTAVLTKGRFVDKYNDYILSLVYKPGSALGDGTIKQLILPSTVLDEGFTWYMPTDRAPDSLTLSEDGTKLVYVYRFDQRLDNGSGDVLHEAGTYTYTADLTSGEVSALWEP